MKKLTLILVTAIFLIVPGCGNGLFGWLAYDDCGDEIENVVANLGPPEEINRYDSGSYHSWDYWYWSRGICYTFTWDTSNFDCEVSTYTFSPIYSYSSLALNSVEGATQIEEVDDNVLIFEAKGQYSPILKITYIGAIEIPTVTLITETEEYDVKLTITYFSEGVILHGVINKPADLVSVYVNNICIDF